MADHSSLRAERLRALDTLMDRALDLPVEERAAWLDELRAEDASLAQSLETMLAAEEELDRVGFLARPVTPPGGSTPLGAREELGALAGLRLGGYTLERRLGQGGMGTVWLARRADGQFEGQVAVKFLNLALVGEAGEARFRREGSVLARLTHPGIARLLDAGVADSGQPYLVLEYVAGEPIDTYADTRTLDVRARVRLLLQVLAAVAHAHSALVVHRDLKPSNILVSGDGTTKLLDFGIAKLLGADSNEMPRALTREGFLVLTPEFAAPEQLRGESITTATDVYAAGVLLYELLTGVAPFDLHGRSLLDIDRIVRTQQPRRPSATFATGFGGGDAHDETAMRVRAAKRGTSPERLQRQLRGDLDAIVLKAMHVDPSRRYASAAAFADDLARVLDCRPVQARADGAFYRLRKFMGRHRAAVVGGVAIAGLLVGAGLRERAQRNRAEAEAARARAVEAYLISVFDVADPFGSPGLRGSDVTARTLLDRGAARIDSALAGQVDAQAELRGVLGRVYESLGLYDNARPLLERALEQRRSVYGPRHERVAEAMDRLGTVLLNLNRFDEAEPLLRDALEQRRTLLGERTAETAESLDHLATLLQERGKNADAEPLFREVIDVRRAVHGADDARVADALNNLALLLRIRARYDESYPLYREALAIDEARRGRDHPMTAQVVHNLAQLEQARGRYAEAETLYRRALAVKRRVLGDTHPSVSINLNNLGIMLAQDRDQAEEAEQLIREALAIDRKLFGPKHSYVAESMRNLSVVLRLRGQFDSAAAMQREVLALNQSLYGPVHRRVAVAYTQLGITAQTRGNAAASIPFFEFAIAQYAQLNASGELADALARINLGRAQQQTGKPQLALTTLEATLTRIDTTNRAQQAAAVSQRIGMGEALTDLGRLEEAGPWLERAAQMARATFGDEHWRTAEARLALSRYLARRGDGVRAQGLADDATRVLSGRRAAQPRLWRLASGG